MTRYLILTALLTVTAGCATKTDLYETEKRIVRRFDKLNEKRINGFSGYGRVVKIETNALPPEAIASPSRERICYYILPLSHFTDPTPDPLPLARCVISYQYIPLPELDETDSLIPRLQLGDNVKLFGNAMRLHEPARGTD